jgi:hypothetical protein
MNAKQIYQGTEYQSHLLLNYLLINILHEHIV